MKKLLVVLEAGDTLPSGVIRGLAYEHLFAENGFDAKFVSRRPGRLLQTAAFPLRRLLEIAPLRNRLVGKITALNENRIRKLAREADIIYLNKVSSYALLQDLLKDKHARVVYDFGDAIWLQEWSASKLNEVLQQVDAVTTDNEVTAGYVRRVNPNCVVIPDAPALHAFDERRAELSRKPDDRVVLGWLGSPATAYNLYVVWEALEELFKRHKHLHLRLVGTGNDPRLIPEFENVKFSCVPAYDQARMVQEVFGMHIGLFPLQDVERCRMRGVFKATNYMSGEAAVIASPVGQCMDFIEDGVNGMLAATKEEWVHKLEQLIFDAELRRRLAGNGLACVREKFRVDQSFAKLKEVLISV
ncbi:MAG TPA: glycosyltransferase family 4 protein [Pyrinomonadaceae bacterium]